MKYYYQDPDCHFEELTERQQETAVYTKEKLAVQELEKTDRGLMISGKHKYELIDSILADAVKKKESSSELGSFDRKALGRHSGKWVAFGIIVLALLAAMVVAAPIMGFGAMIPALIGPPLQTLMDRMNVWKPLADLVATVLPNVLLFNQAMERLGLQGKSVCSFLMSLGCNMAGVAGSRVIDNNGQRFLTMILVWSIPCGTGLSMGPMLATLFFGPAGGLVVLLLMFAITISSMFLASRIFAKSLVGEEGRGGMIMELLIISLSGVISSGQRLIRQRIFSAVPSV